MTERAPRIAYQNYDNWIMARGLTRACVYTSLHCEGRLVYAADVFVEGWIHRTDDFGTLAEAVTWAHAKVYEAQFKAAFG